MKTLLVFSCGLALVVGLNACNKTAVDPTADGSARSSGVSSTSVTGPHSLTAVDVSSLPAAVTTYITTNYAGATIKDARKDEAGNFLVAITVNSSLKLLLFKADGTFVKEAEMRFGHAPGDSAHHHAPGDSAHHHMPGDSTHRPKPTVGDTTHHPRPGGIGADLTEVAVSSLPAAITTYITSNYAGATINKAAQEKTTSDYIVSITTSAKKRGVLLFGSDGTFKKALIGK
ncbi:PepSY-like domain-containing protein [Spirosoma litoris]